MTIKQSHSLERVLQTSTGLVAMEGGEITNGEVLSLPHLKFLIIAGRRGSRKEFENVDMGSVLARTDLTSRIRTITR